ncbi:NAD-dependent protein deacetylase sirtuin-1-like [Sinocyclocheilus rhinocerous]|uniref:NAD-dependent protein deacetylase sirtuin-1-like n=1 Tax=Sinocyclocheilus rhinocerous TaxID=307959 RepID=UPI0007B83D91|nr:PREDICTED: NAD-dependent protein deacetylase sirtuin-1-like [Sinocyclocheilus rhinocerous]
MADGENKRADAAEPLLKRPRLRDPRGDSERGRTEPVEAEPALMDESHPQASLNNNLTEPELSDLIDEGVHPNGFTSPDLPHDDDDCSSRASSSDWTPQPQIGSYRFIQQHIMRGTDPRAILKDLLPETDLPADLDDMTLWQIIINISEPPKRKKRKDINTLEDVVRLLNERKKILVLTGAGVSVSCGIPDFRSRDGIYARLAVDFPDLPDPQAMFDIDYFRRDPRPFFKFAKEIYPGQFQPSPCHRFISMLDKKGRLLRNYTQNIDTLEQAAGIQKIIQCHGSFATASCLVCKHKVDCEAIREDIFNQVCLSMKNNPQVIHPPPVHQLTFFGENLPEFFHRAMKQDKDEVDLLIVIGSSLKVRPVALIPSSVPHDVPQVLINREPLPHLHFDVELLGDCDVIVNELCHRLGGDFEQLCFSSSRLSEITEKPSARSPSTRASEDTSLSPEKEEPQTAARRTSPPPEPLAETNTDQLDSNPKEHSPKTATEALDSTDDVKEEEPADRHRVEVRRRCWRSPICQSPISKRLAASQYLFRAPNRYIFHGAEVYSSSEDESSSSCGSDSDGSRCSADAVENEDSDVEEENTDGLAETVQEREHKRLQTDCTAETDPPPTQ